MIDDVEVIRDGEAVNRITDPGFNSGITNWVPAGTHVLSSYEPAEGFGGPGSMRVHASSRGFVDPRTGIIFHDEVNHVKTLLSANALENEVFTIRAKAKWQAGWPVCVLGFDAHWLEATPSPYVLSNLGSPGVSNGHLTNNAGPALYELSHYPVLPKSGETVTVTCRGTRQ